MSRRGWLSVGLGLLVLLIVVPTVHAAKGSVELDLPTDVEIDPGTERPIEFTVIYTYSGQGTTSGEVDVDLAVEDSEDPAQANVRPSTLTIQVDDEEKRGTGTADAVVTITDDADAFATPRIEISAKAQQSGSVEASERTREELVPQVAFVPDARLSIGAETVGVSEGSASRVTIHLENRGNGRVRYQFETVDAPPGLGVVPPGPGTLSHKDGSNVLERSLRLFRGAEGTLDGELTLKAAYGHPQIGGMPHETNTTTITIVDEGGGGLPDVPLAIAVVAAAGAAGALWWFRYR